MYRSFRHSLLLPTLALIFTAAPALAADAFTINQAVEVREGDTWSKATVIAHEGRKYQIHYEGDSSADEWVTADRIRLPVAATAAAAKPGAGTAAAAPKYGGFKVGDKIEAKWGGLWRKAEVIKQTNGWTMVEYDGQSTSLEWVEPWRLRAVGTTEDTAPYAKPRGNVKKGDPAPTLPPDDGKETDTSAAAKPPAEAAAVTNKKGGFKVGDKIEAKWGGLWRKAEVIKQTNGWTMVEYDGQSTFLEWVEPWRLRALGNTEDTTQYAQPRAFVKKNEAAPTLPPDDGKGTGGTSAAPKADSFKVGDKIEAKWGGSWRQAEILKQGNGWTMVEYDGQAESLEWVEPWRLRPTGSTWDSSEYASPRERAKKNDPPPTLAPNDGKGTTAAPAGIALTKPDLSSGHDLEPTRVEQPLSADAAISAAAPKMISLHHGSPKWEVQSHVIVNPQGKFALMAFTPGSRDEPTSIQRIELAGSDAGSPIALSNRCAPLAISADGTRMLARADRTDRANMWRLDLWSIDSSTPKPLLSFRPYDSGSPNNDSVIHAAYADPSHVLTISSNHMVTLWELSDTSVKEIWSMQSDGAIFPQVSPGGKFITASYGGQIVVVDILTGKCVAKCTGLPNVNGMTSCLRSDAKRLAVTGERRLIVLDLESDKVLIDTGTTEKLHGSTVAWLGLNMVLIDGHQVFDVDHQALVWDYTGANSLSSLQGDHFWYLTESNGGAEGNGRSFLTSFTLPDAKVLAADQHIPNGELLVKPGSTISLQVNVDGSGEDRQKVIDHFTSQLTANGVTIADGQSTRLIVETKAGASETKTFSPGPFGNPGRGNETVTATQTLYRVAFEADGKEVWAVNNISGGYLPNMIWLKKDQSAADAIAAENKPQLTWFMHVDLPRTILKPSVPAGTSPLPSAATGRVRPGR